MNSYNNFCPLRLYKLEFSVEIRVSSDEPSSFAASCEEKIRRRLRRFGFLKSDWFRCSVKDAKLAVTAVYNEVRRSRIH